MLDTCWYQHWWPNVYTVYQAWLEPWETREVHYEHVTMLAESSQESPIRLLLGRGAAGPPGLAGVEHKDHLISFRTRALGEGEVIRCFGGLWCRLIGTQQTAWGSSTVAEQRLGDCIVARWPWSSASLQLAPRPPG